MLTTESKKYIARLLIVRIFKMKWNVNEIDVLRNSIVNNDGCLLRDVKIKLTDKCNLKCPKCDYWELKSKNELEVGDVIKIINEGKEIGLEEIHFSGGEPTMYQKLDKIVEYSKKVGISTRIISNGSFLSTDKIEKLLENGLTKWTISLDATNENESYNNTGISGIIDKVKKNVEYIARSNNLVELNVFTVVSKNNYLQIPKIVQFADSLGAHTIKLVPFDFRQLYTNHKCRNTCISPLNLTRNEITEYNEMIVPKLNELKQSLKIKIFPSFSPFIYGESDKEINFACKGDVALNYYGKNMCYLPWHHLTFFSNGDAFICCKKVSKPVGNIKKQRIKDIFFSKEMKVIREAFIKKENYEQCKSCTSYKFSNNYIAGKI